MQSFGGAFHSFLLTCNLSWDWANGRLQLKEVSSCHLFTEMKYTLVKFLKYVTGSSSVDIVKIEIFEYAKNHGKISQNVVRPFLAVYRQLPV